MKGQGNSLEEFYELFGIEMLVHELWKKGEVSCLFHTCRAVNRICFFYEELQ